MQTIVELSVYQKRAETLLDNEERQALIDYARHWRHPETSLETERVRKKRRRSGGLFFSKPENTSVFADRLCQR